ncbi:MAG TPA: amino acid adenylation domain-containing protein [Acidimicrobiales bacterium]|nr:amino acid adenylation domain-containing protein [Acidimicrobiales bacterium]
MPSSSSPDLLSRVLQHAASRPGAVALRDNSESLTYGQLADRAGQVAAGLRALGAEPGGRVAVHLENSVPFVTTALGALWLGSAWCPLALHNPPARMSRILADCAPSLIVTSDPGAFTGPPAPLVSPGQVLDAAGAGPAAAGEALPAPARAVDPARDAFIIFTSGTTGTPKGVRVSEAAFRRSVLATVELAALTTSTRALAVSAFHFDGSYGLLFPTLVAGGELTVPTRDEVLFPRRFFQLLLQTEATFTSFSPSFLRIILSAGQFKSLSGVPLETMFLGGEECMAADVARLWEVLPNVTVVNRYGPTEATIAVTSYPVERGDVETGKIPIGPPHPGSEFYLLADGGGLIDEPFAQGELYIGGDQLMTGYWRDEALTREVLREDLVAGQRLYRTGDLAYRDDRGRYFYLGRVDDIVKRDAIRISLSEVARAFRGAAGVTGAFSALVERDGLPAIAVFVESTAGVTRPELIEAAKAQLPATMLPDEVFVLEELPMNSQGKVDRARVLAEAGLDAWQQGPPV